MKRTLIALAVLIALALVARADTLLSQHCAQTCVQAGTSVTTCRSDGGWCSTAWSSDAETVCTPQTCGPVTSVETVNGVGH